jgi:hypothetical protein
MMIRRVLVLLIAMVIAVVGNAGEVKFSLDLDGFKWSPKQDVRTRARLAEWNDPMGRLMYHFNQQQAWIMRGTMPGAERNTGVAVRMKAQNGLPLQLIASTIQGSLDLAQQGLVQFEPRKKVSDEELAEMSLEEQLTELLSRRLVPQ